MAYNSAIVLGNMNFAYEKVWTAPGLFHKLYITLLLESETLVQIESPLSWMRFWLNRVIRPCPGMGKYTKTGVVSQ